VTGLEPNAAHPRRRLAAAIAGAGLVAALLAVISATILATRFVETAPDQRAATAKDVIFARKTLMNFMCEKMAAIETMIAVGQIDLDSTREQADAISVMFMAFPHLFPPSSNQWNPDADPDPVTGTYASPEVWRRFSDFYQQAEAAAQAAHDMSRAAKIDDFKSRARELRIICDTCHALYSENQ
jgi:cytochrome c556